MKLNKHECVTNLLVTAESNELVAIARTQTLRERERERERERVAPSYFNHLKHFQIIIYVVRA